MTLYCRLVGHSATRTVRHDGDHFGTCSRCNVDLVERDGKWTAPPSGYHLVWGEAGAGAESIEGRSVAEVVLGPDSGAESPQSRQRRVRDRRNRRNAPLPEYLNGIDRRGKARDRRNWFGRRPVTPSPGS
jgi:hypothetical protein